MHILSTIPHVLNLKNHQHRKMLDFILTPFPSDSDEDHYWNILVKMHNYVHFSVVCTCTFINHKARTQDRINLNTFLMCTKYMYSLTKFSLSLSLSELVNTWGLFSGLQGIHVVHRSTDNKNKSLNIFLVRGS